MTQEQAGRADTLVVLDFETTGLSPDRGDRAIEIGAVKIERGHVVDRFGQLMNPGRPISSFIEDYTGITNAMLRDAPSCGEVMHRFADFVGSSDLVAHNASFDRRFLIAELNRIQRRFSGGFACSMLVARRVYQDAPNHRLGSLVEFKNIPNDGVFHRALADSEMTGKLWLTMLDDISDRYQRTDLSFALMQQLGRTAKRSVDKLLTV